MSKPSVISEIVAEDSLSRISFTSALETVLVEKLMSKSISKSLITSEMRVSGLSDEFHYDSTEGDGSDAW